MKPLTPKQQVLLAKRALRHLRDADGYKPRGVHYREVEEALLKFEANGFAQIQKIPNLGPMTPGGQSILDFDFTHLTTGLGWPAFDLAFTGDDGRSLPLIAPEAMTVDTKDSSAHPGEAFYATGASGIRYWIAHLKDDWPLGHRFRKGDKIGDTIPTDIGGGTHSHVAINLVPVTGQHARYGANGNGPQYTHGPYTLRRELARG
jgi:hypothetical protein